MVALTFHACARQDRAATTRRVGSSSPGAAHGSGRFGGATTPEPIGPRHSPLQFSVARARSAHGPSLLREQTVRPILQPHFPGPTTAARPLLADAGRRRRLRAFPRAPEPAHRVAGELAGHGLRVPSPGLRRADGRLEGGRPPPRTGSHPERGRVGRRLGRAREAPRARSHDGRLPLRRRRRRRLGRDGRPAEPDARVHHQRHGRAGG